VSAPDHEYPSHAGSSTVARLERAQLCDLLDTVGPHAPTLCTGWDTHHLAAHLVVREQSPVGLVSALVKRQSGDEVVETTVAERDFSSLVDTLRSGPPRVSFFRLGPSDRMFNAVEFFVHHEDVRRAVPGYTFRSVPDWAQDQIWKAMGLLLGGLMRKAPVGAALRRSDTGEMRLAAKKPGTVVVVGPPSELAMFVNGRGAVADVTLEGAPDDISALQSAHFGF
jgi:uncharacterized protein (TIGR03085 family)